MPAPNDGYDFRITRAKRQIEDALGLTQPQQPPSQVPMQPMGAPPQQGPVPRAQAQMTPYGAQFSAQVPAGAGQMQFGAQTQGTQLQNLSAQYATPNQSIGASFQPQTRGVGINAMQRFKTGGLAVKPKELAEGGGAWTRKEGKNPEGGLNAKGRASLKAQGQDIKPPVSAKQAKNSPKAAARRSSFCARMGGVEGPMKDEKGRPTRKALALRKWDC